MKEFIKKIIGWVIFILLIPLIVLVLLLWVCSWPLDGFRYRRSRYYKDTGEKFHFGSDRYVRIYDTVKKHSLPFVFLHDKEAETNAYGYWIIKNAAVIYSCETVYHEDKKQWYIEKEEEEESDRNQWFADFLLDACKELPGGEHCDFIYLLVDDTDVPEDAVLSFDTYRVVPANLKNPLQALQEIVREQTENA